MNEKTCCIVGYGKIPSAARDGVEMDLAHEIRAALNDGYKVFISEHTGGLGRFFARRIDRWREEYPGTFWEVVLPCVDEAQLFDQNEWRLLSKFNGFKGLRPESKADYPLSATRYMVEQSSRVIAVYGVEDESDPDTSYAMDYAKKMGRDLRSLEM